MGTQYKLGYCIIISLLIFVLGTFNTVANSARSNAGTASCPLIMPTTTPRTLPNPLFGVTTDSILKLSDIVTSLQCLPYPPITRIVFDPGMLPADYAKAVNQIYNVSYIMGQIVDSSEVQQTSQAVYADRMTQYLSAFGNKVDMWEVGNEVNGEWLGTISDVVAKITNAYYQVKAANGVTELTLYYNEGCANDPEHEMFNWIRNNNLPADMMLGLDYVMISFYSDDCSIPEPDWQNVFTQLHALFPNSKLGFGEIGTKRAKNKAAMIMHYYPMQINVPNYVGGYFWWYFHDDMVPYTKALWTTLKSVAPQN